MIIAWMFIVSTGILFARYFVNIYKLLGFLIFASNVFIFLKRYYKFIFPNIKLLKVQFWFNAHRALMFSIPIFSIVAFIVILADLKWKWVELIETQKVNFAHSIIGIIVIGLSLIQVNFFGNKGKFE